VAKLAKPQETSIAPVSDCGCGWQRFDLRRRTVKGLGDHMARTEGTALRAPTTRSARGSTARQRTNTRDVTARSNGASPKKAASTLVQRAGLVNRLRAATTSDIVLLAAPPGYGKTTLLKDWAARDGRAFARVNIEGTDDAAALADRVLAAVDRAVGNKHVQSETAVRSPEHAVRHVMRRLSEADAIVIACDDVHRLSDPLAIRLLSRLADELQPESQLVVAGRTCAAFPAARWRVADRLFELSTADLQFRDREAAALFRRAGVLLTEDQVEAINRRLEGWPAGLELAARSLRSSATTAERLMNEDDDAMLEYLRRVLVGGMSAGELRFLTRASVLQRLTAQLCDAVVGTNSSASMLARLERKNLFVIPLGRDRAWYRLHPAFRSLLARELEEREPGVREDLHRRAASWCSEHGETELALEHASSAGDVDQLAHTIEHCPLPFLTGAGPESVERWLAPLDDEIAHSRPGVAAAGALALALTGSADSSTRWLRAAATAGLPVSFDALAAPRDSAELHAAAEQALAAVSFGSAWRPSFLLLAGIARALEGDSGADRVLEEAGDAAAAAGHPTVECIALARRSALASDAGEWARADALAAAARDRIRANALRDHGTTVFARAASAGSALRHGDWRTVHADLEQARSLLPQVTYALPVFAVLVRAEIAQVQLALGDADGAHRLLDEIDEIYARQPRFGLFREEIALLRARLARVRERAAVLTAAELRLLPLLTTHLSFREIADRLFVSRNTVKTQAISVYRKLGVSSRGEAIDRASGLGLVPGDGHACCA